jgi:cytochrome b561
MDLPQRVVRAGVNSAFKHLMSIHWVMAACYLVLFMTGSSMSRMPDGLLIRDPLYDFHKSIGALVIAILSWRILVLLRVWWRKYTRRLPTLTLEWLLKFALHSVLYVFMWVVPVSGFLLSNSYQSRNVTFFGVLLPDLFPQNSALVEVARSLHFWFAYTFLAFIALHAVVQWKSIRAPWRRFIHRSKLSSSNFWDRLSSSK